MKATITKKIRKGYAVGLDKKVCDAIGVLPGDYIKITFEKQEVLKSSLGS